MLRTLTNQSNNATPRATQVRPIIAHHDRAASRGLSIKILNDQMNIAPEETKKHFRTPHRIVRLAATFNCNIAGVRGRTCPQGAHFSLQRTREGPNNTIPITAINAAIAIAAQTLTSNVWHMSLQCPTHDSDLECVFCITASTTSSTSMITSLM